MREKTIYVDHAATSYPKPPAVLHAVQRCMREAGGNPGRGSHQLASRAAEVIYNCRECAATLFDTAPERVVFTNGATMSLNLALHGFLHPGDHVLMDNLAHNAVVRPLYQLMHQGKISLDVYDATGTPEDVLTSLATHTRPETRLVIATHMSNICSHVEPVTQIGSYCRERGLLFVVDGAQSAGHLPLLVQNMGITALCLPGHKGLLSPQGCGLLLLGENAPDCTPLLTGGSGTHSLETTMPTELPERLEAGTLPTPAIAGLHAGLQLLQKESVEKRYTHICTLAKRFYTESRSIPGLRFWGDTTGAVLSFTIEGMLPSEVAATLDSHGICVRSGYHCAPVAHRTLGTQGTGTVRVSFGHSNTAGDVTKILEVLEAIAKPKKEK